MGIQNVFFDFWSFRETSLFKKKILMQVSKVIE